MPHVNTASDASQPSVAVSVSDHGAFFADYTKRLYSGLVAAEWSGVEELAGDLHASWAAGRQVFWCGNGGSAGNAAHLANDFLYGVGKRTGAGMRSLALTANVSVITCLANDTGYENVFSEQLAVQAQRDDVLIVLSGSGNSPNVVRAIKQARAMGVKSYAITGYSGGQCKTLADVSIHFAVDDMQIAEDLQLIVGHMLMQWLSAHPVTRATT